MSNPDSLLFQAAQHAEAYLAAVAERPVHATATASALREALAGPLPASGEDAHAVIDRLAAAAVDGTVATRGPRFFGFVVGGSLPVATAADFLTSAYDQNAGIFVLSPFAAVIEDAVLAWTRDIVGLPPSWNGGFVTGGQMANFTSLCAARLEVLSKVGWDVEAEGLRGAPEVEIFVTEEAHYSIERSARMLGLGSRSLRRVPTDEQGRMRPAELESMMKASTGPSIVCAQAGNVNTGAFDPLDAIADLAADRDAWLHVDGAFGLWAALSPERASLLSGIDRASSIATDAHKWLNVPYDCGIVLCARPEVLRQAMTLSAPYIMDSDSERDPHEFVPDESRRARAVPVYAVMRTLGADGLRAMIEQSCDVARRMAERLGKVTGIRILNDVVLNQALVRFEPPGAVDWDDFTTRVIARLQASGTCWFGGTRWKGMTAMRISVSSAASTLADADRSVEAILAAFEAERD